MSYRAAPARYDTMPYRTTGRSGLKLPAVSLGLWHNFGHDRPYETQRAIVRRAFDVGITHFDLANNYGPPYGGAETNFARHLRDDFRHLHPHFVKNLSQAIDRRLPSGDAKRPDVRRHRRGLQLRVRHR